MASSRASCVEPRLCLPLRVAATHRGRGLEVDHRGKRHRGHLLAEEGQCRLQRGLRVGRPIVGDEHVEPAEGRGRGGSAGRWRSELIASGTAIGPRNRKSTAHENVSWPRLRISTTANAPMATQPAAMASPSTTPPPRCDRSAAGARQPRKVRTQSMDSSPERRDGRQQTSPRAPDGRGVSRRGEVDLVSARRVSEQRVLATIRRRRENSSASARMSQVCPTSALSPTSFSAAAIRRLFARPPASSAASGTGDAAATVAAPLPTRRPCQHHREERSQPPRPAASASRHGVATCSTRGWAVAAGAQALRSTWKSTEGLSRLERPRLRAQRPR